VRYGLIRNDFRVPQKKVLVLDIEVLTLAIKSLVCKFFFPYYYHLETDVLLNIYVETISGFFECKVKKIFCSSIIAFPVTFFFFFNLMLLS